MGSFWILNTIIHNFFFCFLMMLIQQSEKNSPMFRAVLQLNTNFGMVE